MTYLEDVFQFQNEREQFKEKINNHMKMIVKELINLVEDCKINDFSFRSNEGKFYNNAFPIVITIGNNYTSKNGYKEIILGLLDNLDDFKIKPQLREQFDNINEYLVNINEYFVKDLPQIKKTSYYSRANARKESPFDREEIELYPEEFAPTNVKKNKIK